MKKQLISILFLLFILSNVYATVDRVIDPEIPIDSSLVDYEENFDDVLVSLMAVDVVYVDGTLASGGNDDKR